jgi:hypothetical protein
MNGIYDWEDRDGNAAARRTQRSHCPLGMYGGQLERKSIATLCGAVELGITLL